MFDYDWSLILEKDDVYPEDISKYSTICRKIDIDKENKLYLYRGVMKEVPININDIISIDNNNETTIGRGTYCYNKPDSRLSNYDKILKLEVIEDKYYYFYLTDYRDCGWEDMVGECLVPPNFKLRVIDIYEKDNFINNILNHN